MGNIEVADNILVAANRPTANAQQMLLFGVNATPCILAEGAIALPVTLSGGVLFAN